MGRRFPVLIVCAAALLVGGEEVAGLIVPLKPSGETFVDAQGRAVRFWGVNLVAPFLSHEEAEAAAEKLAERQINLVRPHHLLRPSADWIHRAGVLALNRMKDNTRDPDPEAWDRFDYLNAQLRKRGIYLALSLHFSREFRPGDADVLQTTPGDREAWQAAVKELCSWNWQKKRDPFKMLPTIDARCRALQEEFARQLLSHVNPYTGLAYGRDPQVLTIEVVNESSAEYCLICGNTFPAYFTHALEDKWAGFLKGRDVEVFDFRKAATEDQKRVRADFCRSLDEDLMRDMSRVVRAAGCNAALTYSNLWRGENSLDMHARLADYIEDHAYVDPLVVCGPDDAFFGNSRTLLKGKPYILGEVNESEGTEKIRRQGPMRTMLPVARSAYGGLHGYAGIVWFAWFHGDHALGPDGWSAREDREPHLGEMVSDGMLLDHLRTCGMIFRKGLVAPSREPQTLFVDEPFYAGDYQRLMAGKSMFNAGWQNIHAIRKMFGPVPAGQAEAPWMKPPPQQPLVSDTGEIVKDVVRRQLTVHAPQAEAFSGFKDGEAPTGLVHLAVSGPTNHFMTLVAVCGDGRPFSDSRVIVISRTCLSADRRETLGPDLRLSGLREPAKGESWMIRVTRPREASAFLENWTGKKRWPLAKDAAGAWALPEAHWHECELVLETAQQFK